MTTDRYDMKWLPQGRQRQDSLQDQLIDLHNAAVQLGMYDAADWLLNQINEKDQ